jgi:hypothetical protein
MDVPPVYQLFEPQKIEIGKRVGRPRLFVFK